MSATLSHDRLVSWFTAVDQRVLSYLMFLVVVLVVWLPGGFNIGPISDGWINLSSGIWFTAEKGDRVLQYVPRALGLALTPGGFVGWQVVLLVLTLARGILVYEMVLRLLDGQRAYALVCGLFALFHPMDQVYFWVDAVNVDMAYTLALAACLAALLHLRHGTYSSLAATWILQLASCFTYTGFVPILGALPAAAWLLRKLAGRPASTLYLVKIAAPLVLFLLIMAVEIRHGRGRESVVASFDMAGVMQGYLYQLRTLGSGWWLWVSSFQAAYLVPAAVAGFVALGVAWRTKQDQDLRQTKRFWLALALTLLTLAFLSYLPYAMSEVRIGHERQMLAPGLFLLMAVLLPLFLWLSHTPVRRRAAALVVAFIAGGTAVTGLEMRSGFVSDYLAQEAVLASVAAAIPQPAAGSVLVVDPDPALRRNLRQSGLDGLSNRYQAFSEALRYMYGDPSLQGVFGNRHNLDTLEFTPGGVTASDLFIPYQQLLLLQRHEDGSMHVIDAATLRRIAPAGTDIGAYRPGRYSDSPAPGSNVCRMLQAADRPAYCH